MYSHDSFAATALGLSAVAIENARQRSLATFEADDRKLIPDDGPDGYDYDDDYEPNDEDFDRDYEPNDDDDDYEPRGY